MHRILSLCLHAALAALLLAPLFYLLHRSRFQDRRKTLTYLLFAAYLSAVYVAVGLPTISYMRFQPRINLVPFRYMLSDFTNSFLNVLLFIPLGTALPLFWPAFRSFLRTVLFGFSTSLLIELLQIFTFRATDVNDLITNTLGTVLGWLAARFLLRTAPKLSAPWEAKELFQVCAVAFSTMFFFQPILEHLVVAILYL